MATCVWAPSPRKRARSFMYYNHQKNPKKPEREKERVVCCQVTLQPLLSKCCLLKPRRCYASKVSPQKTRNTCWLITYCYLDLFPLSPKKGHTSLPSFPTPIKGNMRWEKGGWHYDIVANSTLSLSPSPSRRLSVLSDKKR